MERLPTSRGAAARTGGLVLAVVILAISVVLSLMVGAKALSPVTVLAALFDFDGSDAQAIVRDARLPRTIVGLVVGPALGVCGALIQAFTRNPLADPGILGVNAGAMFAVTLGVGVLGIRAPQAYVWFALIGALVVTLVVYLIGAAGRGGPSAARMTLAGVAIGAVLSGITSIVMLKNIEIFSALRFWSLGSLAGRDENTVAIIAPFLAVGVVLSLLLARPLNAISLGDDLGRTLGARLVRTRVLSVIGVTILAGGATALAGPIAFIGLMVLHAVRWFTGPDQRWIIAYSALVAPSMLLLSDVIGRVVLPTGELQVSIVTAVLGAPVLVALARRKKVSGL
ncbi:iron chelate uptake ABC transporter family permease subunit [Microbacterium sp. EST19A]|uniref:iron chelate uptake ABC transporter family permease subunit n=1 Tax=Microbacterium sp. EST19A TaxID=2862681 RepID=UPI001CC12399|nr:iron chelate uptake ABC transporter family permease subunit [Microbacterium sp. EST19A]